MPTELTRIVYDIRDGQAGPAIAAELATLLQRGGLLSANDLDTRRRVWATLQPAPLRLERVLVFEPDVGIVEWTLSRPAHHRQQGRHVADTLEAALHRGDLVLELPWCLDPRTLLDRTPPPADATV